MPTKEELEAYEERLGMAEPGVKPKVSATKRGAKFVKHSDGGVELPGSKVKGEKYYQISFPRWAYIEIRYRSSLEKKHMGQWVIAQLGLEKPSE